MEDTLIIAWPLSPMGTGSGMTDIAVIKTLGFVKFNMKIYSLKGQ